MGAPPPLRLILASGSPGRRRACSRGPAYTFEVLPAHIDEPIDAGFSDPRSLRPARSPGSRPPPSRRGSTDGIVLAADTVGWLRRPGHRQTGRRGRRPPHPPYCSAAASMSCGPASLSGAGPTICKSVWQEESRVDFMKLTAAELDGYLADAPMARLLGGLCHPGEGRSVRTPARGQREECDRFADGEFG